MASDSAESDWRSSLTASERFENIQRIKAALESSATDDPSTTAQSEAFSMETQAYKECTSREQYDQVCLVAGRGTSAPTERDAVNSNDHSDIGVAIGPYSSCLPVSSGVTSEVFRCKNRALKVIVETRNIEPHNPHREAKILASLRRPCIPLLETFRDQHQRFVLTFPFMPLTLADLLSKGAVPLPRLRAIFRDVFTALRDIHARGIIHRDVKPEAVLLESPDGPAYLSDFGTAWHPSMSIASEPSYGKVLDIGTGPYRAPECLFGNKSYGTAVDMWAVGTVLAECCRNPPRPLFESRAAHEDGNQLGLILSIFKTLGTPTMETWPEAAHFKTPPFEMYRMMDGHPWDQILPEADPAFRDLISRLVRYDSRRATADEALNHECLSTDKG
ncbi:serine/threonine-protein kinase csk1 [Sodiomyces alkalinus F11]|uniref:cyclin-dependent kinase n=1 Tax=Sodiomyces alkalinus (strain CBS 110278 / VKM F-3762 / F11) TaxID=1314773 RepID=A0A3N2Q8Q3_SODAK|nr:serine/threonine-protein kinase csk1 [Sodiomyces alkalinus F11]ROT43028.1 serine/threonine-protein kinase csk1 [Sodiomyces alkalinus F11]